jgi:lysozyme family protein
MRYRDKWPEYAKQWDAMEIKPQRVNEFKQFATFAVANKPKYLSAAAKTGLNWYHIAILHKRESDSQDKDGNPRFDSYLGNGQPLSKRTTIVPKGRGPFPNFDAGCVDAIHLDGLDGIRDWRLEKILFYCEVFNGGGYSRMGKPSPYNWGGTNIQVIGKYDYDNHFAPKKWDEQPGCAPMLWMIGQTDKTVQFVRED